MNGHRPPLLRATKDPRLSLLLSSTSKSFTAPCVHHRNTLNSFLFMRLRTAFIDTEGWGASDERSFKFYFNSPSPSSPCARNFAPFQPLSFQPVTTVNLCNSCLLITIQNAGGGPVHTLRPFSQNETKAMKRFRLPRHYFSVKSRDARDSLPWGIHPDPPVPQRAHPSLP